MSARNRSPFTQSQWQELQHQAMVYKYIACGVPIPHELIFSVKRSLESSLASRLFPSQPLGWGCFQVGFDRKVDTEPGRCKRTDGKKWRCSKEAYPDSRYCERHMHRGKNRSRKPVEVTSSTKTSSISPTISSIHGNLSISTNSTIPSISPFNLSPLHHNPSSLVSEVPNSHNPTHLNTFLQNSLSSSSSRSADSGLTLQNQSSNNFYPQTNSDYRCFSGTREGVVDERVFFPSSESSYKNFSQSQYQTFVDGSKQQQQQKQQYYVLGTDIRSASPSMKLEKEGEDQKPVHQFFGDWAANNTDSWLDLSSNSRVHTDS